MAVPAHTETELSVLARSIETRGGNMEVHDHHLYTREDHLQHDELEPDLVRRGWAVLLALSVIGMAALFGVMIARG